MTNRFPSWRVPAVLVAGLAATAPLAALAEAVPDAAVPGPVPIAEARVFAGTGVGFEAAASVADHRLRFEGGLHGWNGYGFGEAAGLVRVLGPATNSLWLRGGVLFQSVDVGCGMSDAASTLDVSLAYRKRWSGRSLFFGEGGVERLTRADGVFCNDSGIGRGASAGARLGVGGQYAFTRFVGLYGRAGVRTANHLHEIGWLPELWLGLAFEL
jgi:hypothetical protein